MLAFQFLQKLTGMAPMVHNAAPGDYLDLDDLKDVTAGGLVREDVLDQIFDISDIPTVFLDMIGTEGMDNGYTEWTEDKLAAPDITNKRISGSDLVSTDNKATVANAKRVGNHAQLSDKPVFVTDRSEDVTVVGRSSEMGYQTSQRMIELRRDVEAICCTGQASVLDNGDNVAGQSAGLAAWITTNKDLGAGGTATGFNTGTKLVAAQVAGAERGLTWTMIATQIQNVYVLGGNPTVLMSVPGVTKGLGQYLFTTPYAAQPTANVNGSGAGVAQVSQGYIDTFKTDFGTLMQLVPNRLQQTYLSIGADPDPQVANVFGLDPRFWKLGLLSGWQVKPLGKVGHSQRKVNAVDWTLKAYLERANFNIGDIDPTVAVVA